MSDVELREIHHGYGQSEILRGLNLRVSAGEYAVILGASGCGKTTTLKLIAGLQKALQGTVLIDGRSVNDVPPRRRDVAMVFQNDALYPHMTVGKSIAFAIGKTVPSREVASRVSEAAELAGAGNVLERYPHQLSGGELRRAAIAKAIVRRTSVRLMDEPLSALDVSLRHSLQNDLLSWHSSVAGTTLHVTHDGQEAMRVADKIGVMEDGKIVQFGTPQEIYGRPNCRSVALAIGSPPINLLPVSAGNSWMRPVGNLPIKLDDRIQVAVRAQQLRPVSLDSPDHEPGIVLSVQIKRITPLDGRIQIDARAGDATVVALVPSGDSLEVGSEREFYAAAEHVHLFDADSGRRVDFDSAGERSVNRK